MSESVLNGWLIAAVDEGVSDVHVIPDSPPIIRKDGELHSLPVDVLSGESIRQELMELCPDEYRDRFVAERNLDFAMEVEHQGQMLRFRANYFYAGDQVGACFRVIPNKIPDFSWANFPIDLADRLTGFRNGLILFSGVAGSGKTTSLAMLIQSFIEKGGYRIITIEEPVEYLFQSKFDAKYSSVITQREVGRDVVSFADGLKYGLRQDPDVILVGEIRDQETAQIALSAAETGHLVLSTLHTRDAKGAVSRYADLFESNMQNEIRAQLALSLRAVVSQHLLPSSLPGAKRELAIEVMYNNNPMSSAIRMGKLESIDSNIKTGGKDGMVSLDESIRRMMRNGTITEETAKAYVNDAAHLLR